MLTPIRPCSAISATWPSARMMSRGAIEIVPKPENRAGSSRTSLATAWFMASAGSPYSYSAWTTVCSTPLASISAIRSANVLSMLSETPRTASYWLR